MRFEQRPPVMTVKDGDEVDFAVPDSDGLDARMRVLSRSRYHDPAVQPANPVFGPISVEGARPGDALRVEILEVAPDRKIARTWIAPGHGFVRPDRLGAGCPDPRMLHWKIEGSMARLSKPLGDREVCVPVSPFVGCIGTAPRQGARSSLDPGAHGGNLDLPTLGPGTTLWLPVWHDGGLLFAGDLHAAQGAGEMMGGGLEVSGHVRLRLGREPGGGIVSPRFRSDGEIGTIGTERTFPAATRKAVAAMVTWIGGDPFDAFARVTQSCRLLLGGLTNRYAVVACSIKDS